MFKFHVVNRHGLSFTLRADSRKIACQYVMRMLGKRSVPAYITITPA